MSIMDQSANQLPEDGVITDEEYGTINISISVRYKLNGETAESMADELEREVRRAIENGMLTGATSASVEEHCADIYPVSQEAADLDEDTISAWISKRIEYGLLDLEDVPLRMARYAIAEPGRMREEILERMQMEEEEHFAETEEPG